MGGGGGNEQWRICHTLFVACIDGRVLRKCILERHARPSLLNSKEPLSRK